MNKEIERLLLMNSVEVEPGLDYLASYEACRKLENFVIKKYGMEKYHDALERVLTEKAQRVIGEPKSYVQAQNILYSVRISMPMAGTMERIQACMYVATGLQKYLHGID